MTAVATAQPAGTASEQAQAPVDMATMFYGPADGQATDTRATAGTQETPAGAGLSTTQPNAESVNSSATGQESAAELGAGDEKKPDEKAEAKQPDTKKDQAESHRAAAARLGTKVKELETVMGKIQAENAELKARLDGTYREPQAPTPEQIRAQAEFEGREKASRAVADGLFGAEKVSQAIYAPGSDYERLVQAKPWVQLEVVKHAQPTVAAMRVLEREAFVEKYGDDPAHWVEKIRAEIEPAIIEQYKQHVQVTPVGKQPPSVTETRGASGTAPRERSLSDVFYGGPVGRDR